MRILGPKWVRKANAWCVSIFDGNIQKIEWFVSKLEAEGFIKKLE